MSQNENDGFAQFTATGGELNVPFDFKIADRAEIKIIRKRSGVEATLVLNTDYTIADNQLNQDLGGVAVLIGSATPALASDIYTALLNTPYSRGVLDGSSDFNQSGDFFAATLNKQLDFLIRMVNRLARDTAKSLKFSETLNISTAIITETIASGRALIAGSTPGTFIQGPTATDIANAQTYASNASTSALNAATSETNAANSAAAAQASAAGMTWRPPVRVATTANITLSGTQTIDGVGVLAGDRVLVKDQSTASQNGVYVVAAGAWSRATDADTWAELISQAVAVSEGTVNQDTLYVCTVNSGGTLGVTAVTFAAFNTPLVDGSVTFVKMAGAALATSSDINSGTASKIVTAAGLNSSLGAVAMSYSESGTLATGTTRMYWDDTIPQSSEGDEYLSVAHTPKKSTNLLKIEVKISLAHSTLNQAVLALFRNSEADALAATGGTISTDGSIFLTHIMAAGSTSAMTFKARAGFDGAGTTTVNGFSGTRRLGGVSASLITVTEFNA